ncbi:MAG: hypothetical protein RIS47_1005, partial [Bacteroidota bacterium]
YIASAYLGGRAEYNSETVMSESTNTSAVSVAVEAEYKAVSGNGSLDTNNKLTLSNSQTKRTLRVVGGNSEFANNIHDRETYMKWAEGISPMPVLCDFDETSLRPIWEFATSLERRQELEYAFKKILALDENKLPVELASTGMMADNYYFIRPASSNTDYWDLPWYHWDAQTKSAKIGLAPKDNLNDKNPRQGADRFIKIIPSSTPGMVYFQPQHSLFVADITGGVKEPGAELQLWDKGEGNKAQLFMMIEVPGIKNGYNIQSQASGLFLTANGTGKSITQQQKTEGQNQIWIFEKADAIKEMAPPPNGIRVGFKNLKGNRYIDVPGKPDNTNFKGKTIQLWDLDENPDRYFFLEEANHDEAWYMITSLAANLTWDVQGGVKNANTAIQMWDKNRSGAQMFTFEYAGTPRQYYIRNVNSGRLIEADNSSVMANGCKITQTTTGKGSNDNQKWELTNTGPTWFMPPANQNFFIRCAYSNQYWDIPGRGGETTANGVGFKLWDLSDEDGDRKFKIVPAGQDSWVNIVPQNGGKFVTIPANSRDEGTKLCLWTKESNSQMFAIYPTSPVTFTIRTNNWYAIDVAGGDYRKKGSDLCQWGLHYGPNQQFVLIFADGPNKGKALVFF